MRPIDNILVATDLSAPARGVFAYGAALARALTARLTALHVVPVYIPYNDGSGFAAPIAVGPFVKRQHQEALRDLATPPGSDLPLADAVVLEGDPAEEILAYARENAVDLMILGTHARHSLERFFVGSVTERVTRAATCPTLVVPPDDGVRARSAFARVLCAVDLTDASSETVEHAAAIARATGAHLILLHVAEDRSRHGYKRRALSPDDEDAARRSLDDDARTRLAQLLAHHAHDGLTIELRVVFGDARREIERFAGAADLLVIGVRSHPTLDRLFFGSTARHALLAAVAPLLLVPHAREAALHGTTVDEHVDAIF
jgi:nucleotide-binding universal stress UspA family protein